MPVNSALHHFATVLPTPFGALGIRVDADEVSGIVFLERHVEIPPATPLAREAAQQLRAWLDDPEFSFSLPLAPAGTPFQRRVWQRIAATPPGATQSYGELARIVSSSPRAVGGACGANPYPVVVPCHRVIAANGGIGGFARAHGGFLLDTKRWLLAHEQR